MASPIELLRIDGERLDAQVEANLAGGELLRTMDGASTLTLEIHDPQGEILETGVLAKKASRVNGFTRAAWTRLGKVQCTLDGNFFRISGVSKSGSMLTLTFEDEIVALLRSHTRLVRDSRANETRAGFIRYRLIAAVKERHIISWIPALGRGVGKIAKPEAALTKIGQQGIPSGSHVEIKGNRISKQQRQNLNAALDIAAEENASERATLALIEALIVESSALNLTYGDLDSEGILQLRVGIHGATNANSVERSVRLFLTRGFWGKGGAIALARKNPSWKPGEVAQNTQGSGVPGAYELFRSEADAILEAYGGTGKNVTTRERYVYKAGKGAGWPRSDYWSAIEGLAEEVAWRAFTANNVFFYAADKDLIKAQPAMTVAEQPSKKDLARGVQYVGNMDFDWHYNKPVGEVTFTAPADRWLAYPGSVAVIEGLGPCEGRWLNWQFRQSLDSSEMDITLHRPAPAKPEPAATIKGTQSQVTDNTKVTGLTPKQVIDQIVLPIGRKHGLKAAGGGTLNAANVGAANARHGHTVDGNRSDHEGPPKVAWAADMSNGYSTPEEAACAKELTDHFNIPWHGSGVASHVEDGFRYQILFRTYVGGDHYNHVHFGCKAV